MKYRQLYLFIIISIFPLLTVSSDLVALSEFVGIGVNIKMEEGAAKVISPVKGSPAYKAGIKAGDSIIRINWKNIDGLTLDQVVALLKGKKNTTVTLTISRKGRSPFNVKIVRDTISIAMLKDLRDEQTDSKLIC